MYEFKNQSLTSQKKEEKIDLESTVRSEVMKHIDLIKTMIDENIQNWFCRKKKNWLILRKSAVDFKIIHSIALNVIKQKCEVFSKILTDNSLTMEIVPKEAT